jgi:hypothetical protein
MARATCRRCRREISSEEPFCPHCGVRDPADLTREMEWGSEIDPRKLPSDDRGPFRVLLVLSLIFVLVAVALAVLAVIATPRG